MYRWNGFWVQICVVSQQFLELLNPLLMLVCFSVPIIGVLVTALFGRGLRISYYFCRWVSCLASWLVTIVDHRQLTMGYLPVQWINHRFTHIITDLLTNYMIHQPLRTWFFVFRITDYSQLPTCLIFFNQPWVPIWWVTFAYNC